MPCDHEGVLPAEGPTATAAEAHGSSGICSRLVVKWGAHGTARARTAYRERGAAHLRQEDVGSAAAGGRCLNAINVGFLNAREAGEDLRHLHRADVPGTFPQALSPFDSPFSTNTGVTTGYHRIVSAKELALPPARHSTQIQRKPGLRNQNFRAQRLWGCQ